MPALITHRLFGEQVLPSLPSGSVAGREELTAFLIGCQGPDPYFFHWSSPHTFARISHLASAMHSSNMSLAFEGLRLATRRVPERDRGIAEAFSLGMLAHYALDRAAHPYIYSTEYAILRAGVGLERAGSQVHALIESEIDSLMLRRIHQTDVVARPPASFLEYTPRVSLVAGSLLSQVALAVYGEHISTSLYGACVADMQLLYRLIEAQGSFGSRAFGRLERLARHGSQSLLFALSHPVLDSDYSPLANEEHHEWCNIWTGELSTDSIVDRFDRAAEGFGALANDYVNGVAGSLLTGGLNYNGALMADESVPIPVPEV